MLPLGSAKRTNKSENAALNLSRPPPPSSGDGEMYSCESGVRLLLFNYSASHFFVRFTALSSTFALPSIFISTSFISLRQEMASSSHWQQLPISAKPDRNLLLYRWIKRRHSREMVSIINLYLLHDIIRPWWTFCYSLFHAPTRLIFIIYTWRRKRFAGETTFKIKLRNNIHRNYTDMQENRHPSSGKWTQAPKLRNFA